jgi:UDP-glucose 4-epimerase
MRKILITGGAGFIGSHLVEYFKLQEFKILVVDDLTTGSFKTTGSSNIEFLKVSLVSVIEYENRVIAFSPDVVIHAAASYSEPDNWLSDVNNNIIGTINLINVCKKLNLLKFIYLQTSLCYGLSGNIESFRNDAPYFKGKYFGGTSYAITKTAAELFLSISNIKFISLRLANIFGPGNFSGPIPIFFDNLKKKKKSIVVDSTREFLFIRDLINLISISIGSTIDKGYYNVSSGESTSIKEIFCIVAGHLGISDIENLYELKRISADDTKTISLDMSETKRDFNWKVETSFESAISETLDWYEKNDIKKTHTHLKLFENYG